MLECFHMKNDLWFKVRMAGEKKQVFDPIRKRFVALTPEEEVRQLTLHQLIFQMNVPQSVISVEHSFTVNGRNKRSDIVVFNREGKALLIVECKARDIKLSQHTLHQAATYNFSLQVRFLMLTNGNEQLICQIKQGDSGLEVLDSVPTYNWLVSQ